MTGISARAAVVAGLLAVGAVGPALGRTATVVHSFAYGADGAYPIGNMVVDKAGNAYGEASYGGDPTCFHGRDGSCGTVFKLDPAGNFTVLVTFRGAATGAYGLGDLTLDGDVLYGSTFGENLNDGPVAQTLFAVRTDGTHYTVLHRFTGADGLNPRERPVLVPGGVLYDVTSSGGGQDCYPYSQNGCGVLFALRPDGTETVLHVFTGDADGFDPGRIVVQADGTIIGAAKFGGGGANAGLIYSYVPSTNVFTVLHRFGGISVDAAGPLLGGISPDGTIYGATAQGSIAPYYYGTLFQLRKTGAGYVYETIHQFTGGRDGGVPASGPLVAGNAVLIGTAQVVYKYKNGVYTVLASAPTGRNPTIPADPEGTPGLSRSGTIFGTTQYGGDHDVGTVYSITP